MFARKVSMHLKAAYPTSPRLWKGSHSLLRKQKGFLDEITFVAPEERSICISLWDQPKRGKLQPRSLRPSGESPGEGIDELLSRDL